MEELDCRIPLPEQTKPNIYSVKYVFSVDSRFNIYTVCLFLSSLCIATFWWPQHDSVTDDLLSLADVPEIGFGYLCFSHPITIVGFPAISRFFLQHWVVIDKMPENPGSDEIPLPTVSVKLPMFWIDLPRFGSCRLRLS